MSINNMWSQNTELLFFKSCENFASPEQLFYITDENKYFAYWPKDYYGKKSRLQSRNSLIGKFSEKWTANLIKNLIKDMGLFAIQSGNTPITETYYSKVDHLKKKLVLFKDFGR